VSLAVSLIDNHLRLRRRQCEERRHFIAELERLAARLRADARRLQAEIERAVALGNRVSAQLLFERHSKVERSLAAIDSQIGSAGAALAATELELQQYERAFAHRGGTGLSNRRQARRARRGLGTASVVGRDRGT
jgi:phage shock protein A